MSYSELSPNRKLGIQKNAAEFNLTPKAYCQMRLEQDGDRGYRELTQSSMSNLIAKIAAEPSILKDIEAAANAQVEVIEAAREQVKMEAISKESLDIPEDTSWRA